MEFNASAATENGDQLSSTSGAATPAAVVRPSATTADNIKSSDASSHTRTAAASSLSVAQRDHLEHMEGMVELREKMRHRPLRVRCRAFIPSALHSKDLDGHRNNNNETTVTKVVHLVRHGQGFHNMMADLYHASGRTWTQFVATSDNPYTKVELMDCPLTEVGRRQAEALQGRVRALCDLGVGPQLIVSSPHTRALQTALLAFESLLREESVEPPRGVDYIVPFVAHEMVREETGVHVCDQRRPVSQIRREFGPHMVDTSLLPETDELFSATRRETKEEVGDRAYRFLEWLEARPERCLAVSSHSAWLLTLLNGVCECFDEDDDNQVNDGVPSVTSWFQTGEMRTVEMHFVRADP